MAIPQNDVLWALSQPSNIVFGLLLLGFALMLFRVYIFGRRVLGLALILAVLPALFPMKELMGRRLEQAYTAPNPLPERIDGILVLGGTVDWQVSEAREQMSLNQGGERMTVVASLAEHYPNARLVFTGLYKEVIPNEFTTRATSNGFFSGDEFQARSLVFIGEARSTYEEALLSIRTLQPRVGERWILVTSAYHMPRAMGTFQTQGWLMIPYPVDFRTTGNLTPKPSLNVLGKLVELDDFSREWGALFMYQRLGRIEKMFP
ncbi:MAG: YdcF family protein [Trueperaceae bacterium]